MDPVQRSRRFIADEQLDLLSIRPESAHDDTATADWMCSQKGMRISMNKRQKTLDLRIGEHRTESARA
jgi:hypothetical protein